MAIISLNKKARFDYEVIETYQAGLSLSGYLVKQIRTKKIYAQGLFVVWQNDRLEIINVGTEAHRENVPLLLKEREINKIRGEIQVKGIACVVLNLKSVGRWLKAEIGVVKGKNKSDKRRTLKEKAISRDMAREGL